MRDNNTLEENIAKLFYRLINNLLYFNDNKRGLRLYILIILKAKVFKLAYNKIRYSSYIRTYKKLTKELYIFELSTKLYKFIGYYLYY